MGIRQPLEDSELMIRKLAVSSQRRVEASTLLAGLNGPAVPADLATLPSMTWGPSRQEHHWTLDEPNGATATVRHVPRYVTEELAALRLAALQGVGVCQFPLFVIG
jgi:DNA-binding transcriptional LysR family regulator